MQVSPFAALIDTFFLSLFLLVPSRIDSLIDIFDRLQSLRCRGAIRFQQTVSLELRAQGGFEFQQNGPGREDGCGPGHDIVWKILP